MKHAEVMALVLQQCTGQGVAILFRGEAAARSGRVFQVFLTPAGARTEDPDRGSPAWVFQASMSTTWDDGRITINNHFYFTPDAVAYVMTMAPW